MTAIKTCGNLHGNLEVVNMTWSQNKFKHSNKVKLGRDLDVKIECVSR